MIITVPRGVPSDITVRLGKIAVTITVMDPILFTFTDTFFRSLCEVTTGVPSPANAKESAWISPVETEISRNCF